VGVRDLVDGRAWLPAWQEVVVLLAGRLKDPLPLLELLADESKDDLFHHRDLRLRTAPAPPVR
jgi:hypothetical protein